MSILSFLLFKAVTWRVMKAIWPVFTVYSDGPVTKAGLIVLFSLSGIYTAEIGVREKSGKNGGERVEVYLAYVGLKKGNLWCAAFVCWSLGKAGVRNPRFGWSADLIPSSKVC